MLPPILIICPHGSDGKNLRLMRRHIIKNLRMPGWPRAIEVLAFPLPIQIKLA